MPIRVIHVMKEVENEVLKDILVYNESNRDLSKAKSILAVAKKDADMEDQLRWSYCLTSLVGYLYNLCPNSLQYALSIISIKISDMEDNLDRAPNPFQNSELAKKAWEDVCALRSSL